MTTKGPSGATMLSSYEVNISVMADGGPSGATMQGS